jgi:hypothetical protein
VSNDDFSESYAIMVMIYLMAAITYCYKHEIWYHDIILENIFLMSNEIQNIFIGDFGYVIEAINEYRDGCSESIEYITPEILEQSPFTGKRYLVT